jgi:hypothetical protein
MTDRFDIPRGLLRRLATGGLESEERDIVEMWLSADGVEEPPRDVIRRAQAIPRHERPSLLRRLVATLRHDSGFAPALAGTRGPGESRFLTYVADDCELDLEVRGAGPRPQEIAGQMAGGDNWSVAQLLTMEGQMMESPVDVAGMFAFPPVTSPRRLTILGDTVEIVVELPGGSHDGP